MYTELAGRKGKFFGAEITPSIKELAFVPRSIPPIAPDAIGTLAAISRHSPVSIAEVKNDGESFRLKSDDLQDGQLFSMLRKNWPPISGRNTLNYALIHSIGGPESGIWLHRRSPWKKKSEYLHGCHHTISSS